jgi:hypothetical protein
MVRSRPIEYYPTPASNADVIRKPLLVGRHLIILNRSGDNGYLRQYSRKSRIWLKSEIEMAPKGRLNKALKTCHGIDQNRESI